MIEKLGDNQNGENGQNGVGGRGGKGDKNQNNEDGKDVPLGLGLGAGLVEGPDGKPLPIGVNGKTISTLSSGSGDNTGAGLGLTHADTLHASHLQQHVRRQ